MNLNVFERVLLMDLALDMQPKGSLIDNIKHEAFVNKIKLTIDEIDKWAIRDVNGIFSIGKKEDGAQIFNNDGIPLSFEDTAVDISLSDSRIEKIRAHLLNLDNMKQLDRNAHKPLYIRFVGEWKLPDDFELDE